MPGPIVHVLKRTGGGVLATALMLTAACAKFPAGGGGGLATKRLTFTMHVAGHIRGSQPDDVGSYIYIVALRLSTDDNPQGPGPDPIVTYGGNGFVADGCTHFVTWRPSAGYQIWQFKDNKLTEYFLTGVPIDSLDPRVGQQNNTLQFTLDLSQLVSLANVDTIKSVQANFLTMDRYAQDPSSHMWDALGDGNNASKANSPFTFSLRNSRLFRNADQLDVEPQNDVQGGTGQDPNLDLDDWTIQVELFQ